MSNIILFPSSYFSINKVDEDLQKEYDAANETGLSENQDYKHFFRTLYIMCFK